MVDLKKNEASMKAAWKDVTDEKSSTDWALFGYEGYTTTLHLISKGEDGIDEMMEDLNPSKILYGFLKVDDPKTSLPKYVILNWQGETAPAKMKGPCSTHLRDIERFLPGYHLVVNVRNEDDIDMESIVKKVSEITGSSYNFKQKPQGMEHSPEPVGTAHRKINPMQELPNMSEREKFWTRDQDEEKKRIQLERERRSQEQKKEEQERRNREEKESKVREQKDKERDRVLSQMKEKDVQSQALKDKEKSLWEKQQEEDVNEARERSRRADKMRQERAQEAKLLISSTSLEARKIFTRNSSQGQMSVAPALKPRTTLKLNNGTNGTTNNCTPKLENESQGEPTSNKSINGSPLQTIPLPSHSPEPVAGVFEDNLVTESSLSVKESSPVVKESPIIHNSPPAPLTAITENEEIESANIAPPPGFQGSDESGDSTESPDVGVSDGHVVQDLHHAQPIQLGKDTVTLESYGICAVSLYDYQASDETEISFDPGQIITHIDQIDPGWWQGLGPDGTYGLFPANYVEIIDSSELQFESA